MTEKLPCAGDSEVLLKCENCLYAIPFPDPWFGTSYGCGFPEKHVSFFDRWYA